jgi:integrase
VQPGGARLWRLAYRFGGKQKLLALGVYPKVSLARARQAREDAKRLLAEGADPTLEKKRRKQEHTDAVTFRAIADEYVTKLKREGRADTTIAKTEWLLAFTDADLGGMPIRSVDAPAVLNVLRAVEVRGRYESARRLRSTIGSVFRYAIATTRADADPTYALRGALIHVKATPCRNHRSEGIGRSPTRN